MKSKHSTLLQLVALFAFVGAPAVAGPLVLVSLDFTTLSGTPNSALTFSGTIQNNSGIEVFLNGAGGDIPYSELTLGLDPFFNFVPLSLLEGESYNGQLFAVAISAVAQPGDYFGSFSILGGADSSTFDPIASQSFQVTVADTAAVPEPSSGTLLALAMLILITGRAGLTRRRAR